MCCSVNLFEKECKNARPSVVKANGVCAQKDDIESKGKE